MSVNLYTVSLASLVSEPNPYPTINVPITLFTNSNHTTPFLPYTDSSATNVLTSNVITSDRLGQLNLFAHPGTYYGTNPDLGNITITVTNPGSGAFDTRYAASMVDGSAWLSGATSSNATAYVPGVVVSDAGSRWTDTVGGSSTTSPSTDGTGRWRYVAADLAPSGLAMALIFGG